MSPAEPGHPAFNRRPEVCTAGSKEVRTADEGARRLLGATGGRAGSLDRRGTRDVTGRPAAEGVREPDGVGGRLPAGPQNPRGERRGLPYVKEGRLMANSNRPGNGGGGGGSSGQNPPAGGSNTGSAGAAAGSADDA